MSEVQLVNDQNERSGQISVVKQGDLVRIMLSRGRVMFDVTMSPSVARHLARMLDEAVGPESAGKGGAL